MKRQPKPPANELIIDNFAGGGGASTGIELALGRSPDAAINHDPLALAMHTANHPLTRHYATDVFEIDPRVVTRNRPVGLAWFSPDCTHHSKARGCKPIRERGKKSRALAWVVIKWAMRVKPRVIILENVEEFAQWGPVIPVEGPNGETLYVPCPARKGKTFRLWVSKLRRLGYAVEWRELRACDYGAPTIRKRLFVVARCDRRKIVWPEPTHGRPDSPEVLSGERLPWRTAAEIIDWSLPIHSIFLSKEEAKKFGVIRPLAANTMARIAAGFRKFVIDAPQPFIVNYHHSAGDHERRTHSLSEPMPTLATAKHYALAVPFVTAGQHGGSSRPLNEPLHTVTASGKDQNQLCVPWLTAVNHGSEDRSRTTEEPLPTITGTGSHALAAAWMAQHNLGMVGRDLTQPLSTITTTGTQQQLVTAYLSKYYGNDEHGQALTEPLHTLTTLERFGLVTVHGTRWQVCDIGLRMLSARELFRAQGFPDSYQLDPVVNGKPLCKRHQVRMCGNSVCPPLAQALVAANVPELAVERVTRGQRRPRQLELQGV